MLHAGIQPIRSMNGEYSYIDLSACMNCKMPDVDKSFDTWQPLGKTLLKVKLLVSYIAVT